MWKKISGRCFGGTFRCLKSRNCGRNWRGEGATRVLRGPEASSRAHWLVVALYGLLRASGRKTERQPQPLYGALDISGVPQPVLGGNKR